MVKKAGSFKGEILSPLQTPQRSPMRRVTKENAQTPMLKLKNINIANERSELLIPNFAKHANSIVEPSLMQINQMVLNTPASSPYF